MPSHLNKRKLGAGILATIGTIVLATGCATVAPTADAVAPTASGSWESVVAAAKKEGELQVWAELGAGVAESIQAAFAQEYPEISVTVTSVPPPNLTQRVDAEQAARLTTVDVILQTNRGWRDAHAADSYFATLIGPDLKAADEQLRGGTKPLAEGKAVSTQILYNGNTSVTAFFGPYGYAWNTEVVKEAPASFEALFANDTFKDRMGMNAPDASPTTTGLYELLSKRYPDAFSQVGKLNPSYFPNGSSLVQSMTAGAIDVAFTLNPSIAGPNIGFAFDDKFPIPATAMFGEAMAAAPHSNAAQVFANWLATAGGSQAVSAKTFIPILPASSGGPSITDVEIFEEPSPNEVKAVQNDLNSALGR